MRHAFIPYAIAFREPVVTAAGTWTLRRGAWLRIEADDGRIGLGEAAPLDPLASDAAFAIALERPLLRAAAFELAALDLEGQRKGLAIAELLGASGRHPVPVNALCWASDVDAGVAEAVAAVAQGYRTIKLKVGSAAPEKDMRRIAAIRDAVGAGPRLRLDANGAWDEPTALVVLRALERLDIEYIEDPIAPGGASLRGRCGVPVACDARSAREARDVIRRRSADVLVLKPLPLGGLRIARALAAEAFDAGIDVVVTSAFETAAGVAGALHLAASLPASPRAHGLATAGLLRDAPLDGLAPPSGGAMTLPRGAGLGVRLRAAG